MKVTRVILPALLASTLMIAGCSGGGANVTASSTTMGQELQDLEESYKQGIITEREYNKAKDDILKRYR
jgi:hypothetical protein